MENGNDKNIRVAILTISTSCFRGTRKDTSGDMIEKICRQNKFSVEKRDLVPDNKRQIKKKLKEFSDRLKADIILTTGGTGVGPYDFTPEVTKSVCDKIIDGFTFLIFNEAVKKTKKAVLSRGISGIRKGTIIINLPGSPKAVSENLNIIIDLIPHTLHIINGGGH